jgi:hypothetical protein
VDESVEVVRCRDVNGRLREITLVDRGTFNSRGSGLEHRLVSANNVPLVQKFVSRAAGERNTRLYELLDNEIRAGTRLGQVFSYHYPPELARLAAYNMDAEEPFVLLYAYTGEPAVGPVSRFDNSQRREFEIGLLRALQLTAAAEVVHGAVTMDAVYWDNGQLQLVNFESAERAGEPRRRGGLSPVRSPEQLEGSGNVDVRDDMWAAGLLIRSLYVGASMDGAWQDRSHDPERLRVLDLIFGKPVEQRPGPRELLGMLPKLPGADIHLPRQDDPEARLAEGRLLFDQVSERKRKSKTGAVEATNDGHGVRQPGKRPWRLLPFLVTTVLVTTLIVGLAVRG